MSLTHKITAYLGREPNFQNEVIVQDDGGGAYIKEWNAEDKEEPTSETLNTFAAAAQKLIDDNLIIENRRSEYPELAEQLDLIWHAIDTDTLNDRDYRNKFYTRLKKVKEDNPKG